MISKCNISELMGKSGDVDLKRVQLDPVSEERWVYLMLIKYVIDI